MIGAQRPTWDLSAGLRDRSGRAALSALWQLRFGPLSIGAGPRLTAYQGAPGRFTRRGGDTTLPDTARVDPGVFGLNLMVSGGIDVVGPLGVGANLDLAGAALGPSRRVGSVKFTPSHGSLFLYGHRDRGSLNSEFFVRLKVGPRWTARAGLSHYVVGYTGTASGQTGRYDRFTSVPFVAVSFRP